MQETYMGNNSIKFILQLEKFILPLWTVVTVILWQSGWFTTNNLISAYHHCSCHFEYHSWRCVLDTTLYDKVCQWLTTGRWFSPDTPVSSTIKTDRHDITEISLKVELNTILITVIVLWNNIEWLILFSLNHDIAV